MYFYGTSLFLDKIHMDNPLTDEQLTQPVLISAHLESLGPSNYESLRNAIAKACAQFNNSKALFDLMDLHSGLRPQAYASDVKSVQIYLRANRDIWDVLEQTLDGLRNGN